MRNILILFKNMLKSEQILGVTNTKDSKIKKVSKIIIMVIAFLIIGASVSTIFTGSYDLLKAVGKQGVIITNILTVGSILTLFFGIFTVISSLYYSNDFEKYLFLPVKIEEFLSAKFLVNYVYQIVSLLILISPTIVIYGFLDKQGIMFYLKSLIAILLIPIAPIAIASILIIILMRYSRVFKNKDAFKMVTYFISFVTMIGLNFFIQSNLRNKEAVQNSLIDNSPLTYLFPSSSILSKNMFQDMGKFILALLVVIVISIICFAIYYFVGSKLYLNGALGLNESSSNKKALSKNELLSKSKSNSLIKALVIKDLKIILRTPAFVFNLVMPSLIFLVIGIGGFIFSIHTNAGFEELKTLIASLKDINTPIVAFALASVYVVMSGFTPVTATTFTREGKSFMLNKFLPISYRDNLISRLITALLVNLPVNLIITVALFILFPHSRLYVLLGLFTGLLLSISVFAISFIKDSLSPNLLWEDEMKAVKQSFSVFISMALSYALVALIIVFSLNTMKLSYYPILFILLSVIIFAVSISVSFKIAEKGLSKLEL